MAAPSKPNGILRRWNSLTRLPGGSVLFSIALGRMARYTGSITPRVKELAPGYCRVEMKDRPKVRNHLRSIHALAMMNLAEVASGLAMMAGIDDSMRGIITRLSIDYLKKGRGVLTAECRCELPVPGEKAERLVAVEVRDLEGDLVAQAEATWLVGPKKE